LAPGRSSKGGGRLEFELPKNGRCCFDAGKVPRVVASKTKWNTLLGTSPASKQQNENWSLKM
jgi:hypothetical protein